MKYIPYIITAIVSAPFAVVLYMLYQSTKGPQPDYCLLECHDYIEEPKPNDFLTSVNGNIMWCSKNTVKGH